MGALTYEYEYMNIFHLIIYLLFHPPGNCWLSGRWLLFCAPSRLHEWWFCGNIDICYHHSINGIESELIMNIICRILICDMNMGHMTSFPLRVLLFVFSFVWYVVINIMKIFFISTINYNNGRQNINHSTDKDSTR